MRNLTLLLALIAIVACSQNKSEKKSEPSLQERAEALAAEYTKGTLYVPESYEPVETKIDSAFTSIYNDNEIYAAAHQILKIESENPIYWISPSERETKKLMESVDIIKRRAAEITPEFCGWQIYHRCRVKDRWGNPDFVEALLFTDKNITEVTLAYDMSDDTSYNYDEYTEVIECAIDGYYETKIQSGERLFSLQEPLEYEESSIDSLYMQFDRDMAKLDEEMRASLSSLEQLYEEYDNSLNDIDLDLYYDIDMLY